MDTVSKALSTSTSRDHLHTTSRVAAVRLFALVTGATCRCLPHIPFGASTARERRVQPPIDPSTQAA